MNSWEAFLGVCIGIGLSACCGFRVFLPLLGLSLGAKLGYITLSESFHWLNHWGVVVALASATISEIVAYYIPYFDHLLDTLMTPLSIAAGTMITASTITGELTPFQTWSLALIAGGGAAGLIQMGTVMTRGTSTLFTAGLGNFVVATLEWVFSLIGVLMAIFLPLFLIGIILLIAFLIFRRRVRAS